MDFIRKSIVSVLLFSCSAVPARTQEAVVADQTISKLAKGQMISGTFIEGKVFPGTKREYSVYVPAQYNSAEPACLMVFQDGPSYSKLDGAFRIPLVFDELIERKEIPVTIAVFITPGTVSASMEGAKDRSNRSFEYDSMGDRYVEFLSQELLPVALKELNVSTDPKRRAIAGISSGGICAFTAAWERPDLFGKVMSHIGSFTNIRGGWAYPGLIRKSKPNPKPLKVYLQEGKEDLNNLFGNWPLSNEDMAAALRFAGYEYKFDYTGGGHSGVEGGKIIADALRWLWSDQVGKDQPVITADSAEQPAKKAWKLHPDAQRRDAVPHGIVEAMPTFESKLFPNTGRDWAIYIPAQIKDAPQGQNSPAALMVFQDGHNYQSENGPWRVPLVFDNLIASGEMPPTVAVFINPGYDLAKGKPKNPWQASNRSLEYDSLSDRYVRFVLEEILPEVEKRVAISKDPEMRAICGASSGGICAFTAAWERPDAFGKVLSTIGSFVHLRGGNLYPSLIRKTEKKHIRVYLADTSGDLDNPYGHWPTANKQMASALQYMGYDVRFDWEEGYGHNADHGGSIFPDALRWLWRKEKPQPAISTVGDLKGDLTLLKLLIPEQGWELVADNLGFADAPCSDSQGNFYFSDMKAPAVLMVDASSGAVKEIAKEALSGMKFGPDGLLYGCQGAKKRVVLLDPKSGAVKEVATDVIPNDLAISMNGFLYITETKAQQITRIAIASGEKMVVDHGLAAPNGIAISKDGGTLAVSEYQGRYVWTFRVHADGSLDAKMPSMTLRQVVDTNGNFEFNEPPPYKPAAAGDGMSVDRIGRYYVTSALGVQVFDPTGRQCGVLPKPNPDAPLTSCVLAGSDFDYLYVTNGDKIFRRKLAID